MKIQYDAATALKVTRENNSRAWMFGPAGTTAKDRFNADGPIDIQHNPKFLLDRSWPIFTMGSCFAREIESVLVDKKLRVLLKDYGIERKYFGSFAASKNTDEMEGARRDRGALNKYTVHSMAHEIRSALRGNTYPDHGLIKLNDTLWNDPHSAGVMNADYDTTLSHRNHIAASTAEIRNAKVVFLTLGLTETWIYAPTNMPMNAHPGSDWLVRMKDKLTFVDYGYADALDEMISTIELIREVCDPQMKFIVTVSPVPLGATFKPQDIIVANSGSKSVLRAVAEELYRRFNFVDYFPSYEIVTHSPRSIAYGDDHLHVRSDVVRFITSKFVKAYYPDVPE